MNYAHPVPRDIEARHRFGLLDAYERVRYMRLCMAAARQHQQTAYRSAFTSAGGNSGTNTFRVFFR